jgi:hypothetical protein
MSSYTLLRTIFIRVLYSSVSVPFHFRGI